MLSLSSERWATFHTFSGPAREIPDAIRQWRAAIGSDREEGAWEQLSGFFLQLTDTVDAIYAIAPYLATELPRMASASTLRCVIDLGIAEAARAREGWRVPADLASDYREALATVLSAGLRMVGLPQGKSDFRDLVSAICNLAGHSGLGMLLFQLDSVSGTCERCGISVYPEEIQASGY